MIEDASLRARSDQLLEHVVTSGPCIDRVLTVQVVQWTGEDDDDDYGETPGINDKYDEISLHQAAVECSC